MAKTGETCTQSGKYRCGTHTSYTIYLSKGETFPPCNHNDQAHGATWVLVG